MAESDLKDRTRFRSSEIRLMLWLLAFGLALGAFAAYVSRYHVELSRIFPTKARGFSACPTGSLICGGAALEMLPN